VKVGDNLQINLNCDTEEELRRLFSGLSVRGNVTMPIEDTFWGAVYGSLTDQFGISWSLNYKKPQAE
jgi:PhnB protein